MISDEVHPWAPASTFPMPPGGAQGSADDVKLHASQVMHVAESGGLALHLYHEMRSLAELRLLNRLCHISFRMCCCLLCTCHNSQPARVLPVVCREPTICFTMKPACFSSRASQHGPALHTMQAEMPTGNTSARASLTALACAMLTEICGIYRSAHSAALRARIGTKALAQLHRQRRAITDARPLCQTRTGTSWSSLRASGSGSCT